MPLSETFADIVVCLQRIAERWNQASMESTDNLAFRFTDRLQQAAAAMQGEKFTRNSLLDIRQPVYSEDVQPPRSGAREAPIQSNTPSRHQVFDVFAIPNTPGAGFSPDSMSLAFPPMPISFQSQHQHNPMMTGAGDNGQAMIMPPINDEYTTNSAETESFDELAKFFEAPFPEVCRYNMSEASLTRVQMSRVSTYGN